MGMGRADYGNMGTGYVNPTIDGYSSPIQLPGSNYYYAMTQGHNGSALRAAQAPGSRYK